MVVLLVLLAMFALGVVLLYSAANTLVESGLRRRKGIKPGGEEPNINFEQFADNPYYVSSFEIVQNTKFEKLSIVSEDGLVLCANYYKKEGANNTAIVMPGWKDYKESFFAYVRLFMDMGLNVLLIDQRAQGESEGEYNTFGVKESSDMLLWIKLLKDKGLDGKIVLFGVSMGAATAMMTACTQKDNSIIACTVEDCGYTGLAQQTVALIKDKAPFLSGGFSSLLLKFAKPILKRRAKFNLEDASPVDRLANCEIPMLFIHGVEDTFVPYEMLEDLYSAHPGPKQCISVDGAVHAQSLYMESELYVDTVSNFVNQYI
jgi:fermentation-respiration switch protein FrsA (DUF1100 family)